MKLKSLFALSIMLVAAGCESDDNTVDQDKTYTSPPPTNQTTGTTGTVTTGVLTQTDRDFVKDAASGGMFEVQSSQFALQQQGVNPSVMRTAQMMVEDHTRANQELQAIASRKGITVPERLNPQHQQMLDRLRSASGANFAGQYFEIQRQAHEETIALFQRAVRDLDDPDLQRYAQNTLPVLQRHLQHIQQYAISGVPSDSHMRQPAHQPTPPRTPPYPDADDVAPEESPIPPNSPR